MTQSDDDVRRAMMALQDGLVDLVSSGMDIADRKRLRDIWFQARSAIKDTTFDGDEEVERERELTLRVFTQDAVAIAEKYNRVLNTVNPEVRRDPFKDLDHAFFL
ncbi:hypothetical protein [Mycobacteroides abscessus]|uniref:hypothetical protein n=1 Tax=Mycobacteroides abscessus TaxID=36809 RepID=UPI0009A85B06|nr:hypothetical protein [Mycobacteroides abscessus]